MFVRRLPAKLKLLKPPNRVCIPFALRQSVSGCVRVQLPSNSIKSSLISFCTLRERKKKLYNKIISLCNEVNERRYSIFWRASDFFASHSVLCNFLFDTFTLSYSVSVSFRCFMNNISDCV